MPQFLFTLVLECFWTSSVHTFFKKLNEKKKVKMRSKRYHGGSLRRSFHEVWYCGLQTSQQLSVDGHLEEAVEVLAMRKAQEVMAVTSRYRHREHYGVQQQVHQLLTLQRNSNVQQAAMKHLVNSQIRKSCIMVIEKINILSNMVSLYFASLIFILQYHPIFFCYSQLTAAHHQYFQFYLINLIQNRGSTDLVT